MERPSRFLLLPFCAVLATDATGDAGALPLLPDPPGCIVEARLVGCPSGDALAACPSLPLASPAFSVRVRDVHWAPIAHEVTILRFTDPAIRLYEDPRPGTTVDCANRSLRRLTDSEGWVHFAPRIGGTSAATTAAELSAVTIVFGTVPVTTTDLDGDGLTGLGDLAIVVGNFLAKSPDRRTDYDGCVDPVDGATTLADLAIFAAQFGRPLPDGICF